MNEPATATPAPAPGGPLYYAALLAEAGAYDPSMPLGGHRDASQLVRRLAEALLESEATGRRIADTADLDRAHLKAALATPPPHRGFPCCAIGAMRAKSLRSSTYAACASMMPWTTSSAKP